MTFPYVNVLNEEYHQKLQEEKILPTHKVQNLSLFTHPKCGLYLLYMPHPFPRFHSSLSTDDSSSTSPMDRNDPFVLNGFRPVFVAMMSLLYNHLPPGNFFFMDDEENIVSAVLYCQFSHRYTCVIYQEQGRYTHWRHVPI